MTDLPPGAPIGHELPTCARHPDRATGLRCTRCERPMCPECLREASVGYQCVDCVSSGQRSVRRPVTFTGAAYSPTIVATYALIAVNVAMFALTAVLAGSVVDNQRSDLFADLVLWPYGVADGEWWRLVTSGFLHFGPAHIALNMIALYVLGRDLEPAFGKVRFLGVYFASLLGGGVAVYLFGGVNTPVAGASGAVYGLMGALLVALLRRRLNPGSALGVIGLNLVISFSLPGISLLGHLGGLVVGALVAAGIVYAPAANRNAWQSGAVVAAFALLVVLAVVRTGQLA
ncbi:rhomboid family intramembrane serine protease [Actinosynnema sp. NPDC020468]|uniref:rhomboid family intramembrane serine protease n=1 Tax=Actinosynnema sp. NPDC020468 TaxID=3154488 RepID=UPI0033F680D2